MVYIGLSAIQSFVVSPAAGLWNGGVMRNKRSMASLLIFAGSALCFFFPFITVSCGGVDAFTLSGWQLATGTTLTQPHGFGSPQTQNIDSDPFAVVAVVCALAGIGLSFAGKKMAKHAAISGGVGTVSLVILQSHLDSQIQGQTNGLAKVNYEMGYTLALILLIAGAAWNAYLIWGKLQDDTAISADEKNTLNPAAMDIKPDS